MHWRFASFILQRQRHSANSQLQASMMRNPRRRRKRELTKSVTMQPRQLQQQAFPSLSAGLQPASHPYDAIATIHRRNPEAFQESCKVSCPWTVVSFLVRCRPRPLVGGRKKSSIDEEATSKGTCGGQRRKTRPLTLASASSAKSGSMYIKSCLYPASSCTIVKSPPDLAIARNLDGGMSSLVLQRMARQRKTNHPKNAERSSGVHNLLTHRRS
jgi:hypothetical protein